MVKKSLCEAERWRKGRARELDFPPLTNMNSWASFVVSVNLKNIHNLKVESYVLLGGNF